VRKGVVSKAMLREDERSLRRGRAGENGIGDEAKKGFDQALVDSTIAALDALGPTVKESIFLLFREGIPSRRSDSETGC